MHIRKKIHQCLLVDPDYFFLLFSSHRCYIFDRLFGACIAISCALNLLIPVCIAHIGFAATCTVRCLQGISEV